ncbi:MAG: putative bifunctional diguanylate cyclase/phosphodiesterase [Roseiarcus sp.]
MDTLPIIDALALASSIAAALGVASAAPLLLRRRARRRWRDIALDNMNHGVTAFDRAGRLMFWNRRFLALHKLSEGDVRVKMTLREVLETRKRRGSFDGPIDPVLAQWSAALARREAFARNFAIGDDLIVAVVTQPLADGGWVAIHEDVTALERARQRVAYLARTDLLTQLPNRSAATEHIREKLAVSSAGGRRLALFLIDVDRFKFVNDSYGHLAGDAFLRAVALRLRENARAPDCVARYSGDEFVVVAQFRHGETGAAALADRLSKSFAAPLDCGELSLRASVSIGVALADREPLDIETLLRHADFALYQAKAAGRGCWRFFNREMERALLERAALRQDLALALERGELELYYQPLVSLPDARLKGFEALLRWRHPRRGLVLPGQFVPIAEESGMIDSIGEWVIATACREAASWTEGLRVAVNVSPAQFVRADVPAAVARSLAASRLGAHRLELEIAESVIMNDDSDAAPALARLREMGVALALDDFGEGYASVDRLRRFRFDRIKIDGSFVAEQASGGSMARALVRAIARFAVDLGVATTAEGVETLEQLECVRAAGVDEAQGYYFSRPVPAAEVAGLIARDRLALAQTG